MKIIGIDYSLTCPCVCIFNKGLSGQFSFDKCVFDFLTTGKKYTGISFYNQIYGHEMSYWKNNEHRYDLISSWVMKIIKQPDIVGLEGYSFGSKGRAVFNIAENCGILKFKFYKNEIPFILFAPSEIKKFATGKGNANKEKMAEAFKKETGIDIKNITKETLKQSNPSSDIIDSYYITKLLWNSRQ